MQQSIFGTPCQRAWWMQEVDTDQLLEGQIHARPVNRQITENEGRS